MVNSLSSIGLHGFPLETTPSDSPTMSLKPSTKTNISTHNVELPPINSIEHYVDVSDSKVESLLEQQIVLLKLILLFLGFLILSNVFKKN